jgi:lipopolysaccharide biosynthesis regulator YciM
MPFDELPADTNQWAQRIESLTDDLELLSARALMEIPPSVRGVTQSANVALEMAKFLESLTHLSEVTKEGLNEIIPFAITYLRDNYKVLDQDAVGHLRLKAQNSIATEAIDQINKFLSYLYNPDFDVPLGGCAEDIIEKISDITRDAADELNQEKDSDD